MLPSPASPGPGGLDRLNQQLGNLHGVEGGSLEELIADDPEGEAVFHRAIDPDAADGAVVAAGDVEG